MSESSSSDNSSPEAHSIACESLHSSSPASNQPSQGECPQDRSARLRSLDTDDHASPTSHPPPPSAAPASDESSLDDDAHPQHQSPPPSSDDEQCVHLSDEDFSPATFAHGESQLMSGPQCGLRASAVTSDSPPSSSSEDTNSYSSAISPKEETRSHKHAKKHLTSVTPHNTPTTAAGKCHHSRSKRHKKETEKKADKKPSKKIVSRIEAPEASETSMLQPRQAPGNGNQKKAKAMKHPTQVAEPNA
ncbi:MAG: hypothetical protein Q8P67_03700 [archaeon]|nr:hypothetical protein [archaeon]